MHGILENLIPNVMSKPDELWQALLDTFVMVALSGIIAFFLGLFFGVILNVTKKDGILSNTAIYQVIDKLINIFRSIPFIILLTLVLPLTRAVVGTGIGVQGAIVPLIFGTVTGGSG